MDRTARISVVIPAFNAEPFIERSIRSASRQTLKPVEIIVIDDASTDRTVETVEFLAREMPEIRLIRMESNGGPSRARNAGIMAASGDWIAILDADDAMKPRRLEVLWRLAERTGSPIVADNLTLYDSGAGCEVGPGFHSDAEEIALTPLILFNSERYDVSHFGFGLIKPMFDRQALLDRGALYDESQRYGEDTMLLAKCLFEGMSCIVSVEANYIYTTRIGEISGKLSSFSRSSPRFDLIVEAMNRIHSTYRERMDAECGDAIAAMIRFQKNVHKSNVIRAFRKQRQFRRYAGALIADPELIAFLGRRSSQRLMKWAAKRTRRSLQALNELTLGPPPRAPAEETDVRVA